MSLIFILVFSQNNCNCNDSKKTKEPTTVETIYAGKSSVWNLSHPITDYDKILIMFDPILDLGGPTVTYFEPYGSIVLDSWHLKMMLLPQITMIDIPSIGSITLHGEANDNPSTVSKIIVDWNGEPKFIRIFGLNFSD